MDKSVFALNKIFEDYDLLVIDKPSGLETTKRPDNNVSVEMLVTNSGVERNGIIHRLDKDTSGVLVIAKNNRSYENIKLQFRQHSVRKVYYSMVSGITSRDADIKSYIIRDPKRKQAMKSVLYLSGLERGNPRQAVSIYQKMNDYNINNFNISFLKIEIKTGRTHQVRVHMQSIGHPVLGDKMYFTKESKKISGLLGLDRQFLHAIELEITHPKTGDRIKFNSKLPDDLQIIIKKLELCQKYL